MPLKPDRIHIDSRIDHFMDHTADRGGIVAVKTAGSGIAMDQAEQEVEYPSDPSGVEPVGVLMCDVVNYDLTRQRINENKEEVQKGGKVTVWTKCEVTTDYLASGITVSAGDAAYVDNDGRITNDDANGGSRVGSFRSKKNEDGFAKVSINLPRS